MMVTSMPVEITNEMQHTLPGSWQQIIPDNGNLSPVWHILFWIARMYVSFEMCGQHNEPNRRERHHSVNENQIESLRYSFRKERSDVPITYYRTLSMIGIGNHYFEMSRVRFIPRYLFSLECH